LKEFGFPAFFPLSETARCLSNSSEDIHPLDSTHLFFEELRRISRALREIKPEDLTEEDVDSVMPALDQLSTILYQIEKRKARKDQQLKKLVI